MSNQITPSVTTPKIAEIYQDIESGKLVLRPDFQRKFVWTHEHQEEFIDTILNRYPFPEIYVCQGSLDIKKLKTTQNVIDGQQRLTTIKNYIENSFGKPLKQITSFDDLTEVQKEDFLSYQIVFRDIGKVKEEVIKEVFRRINLTKFKLEDIEIHNAIYDGAYIKTAKNILENILLEDYGVFYESEFTRMADLHFILLVMSTLETGGYFPQDKEIERCISTYNDEYSNSSHMKSNLIKAFAIIEDCKLSADSMWFRKSCFFTFVVETCLNLQNIPNNYSDKLNEFESILYSNKSEPNNDYSLFYKYIYSNTTARKARVERARIFKKHILNIDKAFNKSNAA